MVDILIRVRDARVWTTVKHDGLDAREYPHTTKNGILRRNLDLSTERVAHVFKCLPGHLARHEQVERMNVVTVFVRKNTA